MNNFIRPPLKSKPETDIETNQLEIPLYRLMDQKTIYITNLDASRLWEVGRGSGSARTLMVVPFGIAMKYELQVNGVRNELDKRIASYKFHDKSKSLDVIKELEDLREFLFTDWFAKEDLTNPNKQMKCDSISKTGE